MFTKIKLCIITVLVGGLLGGFAPVQIVRADHGGVEQDDCLPGHVVNESHSACVEANSETDPNNCLDEGTPDRIEQCLGGFGDSGPPGAGFDVGGTGTLPVGDTTIECDDVANPESDNILCRLIQFVNFLSIGVTVVAGITIAVAGFQYIASRGDPNKTAQAINRLIQVGTAILLYVFGWALLNWLIPGGQF